MDLELTEFLYNATRARLGIVIETDDPERLRQKLYAIRKSNPDFTALSFLISPFNGRDLWIVNKGNTNAED